MDGNLIQEDTNFFSGINMEFKGTLAYTIAMVFLGIAIILNAIADSQTQDELNKLKSYVNTLVEKYFGKYELVSKINIIDIKYIACHCPCPGSPHPNGSQHLFQFVSGLWAPILGVSLIKAPPGHGASEYNIQKFINLLLNSYSSSTTKMKFIVNAYS